MSSPFLCLLSFSLFVVDMPQHIRSLLSPSCFSLPLPSLAFNPLSYTRILALVTIFYSVTFLHHHVDRKRSNSRKREATWTANFVLEHRVLARTTHTFEQSKVTRCTPRTLTLCILYTFLFRIVVTPHMSHMTWSLFEERTEWECVSLGETSEEWLIIPRHTIVFFLLF